MKIAIVEDEKALAEEVMEMLRLYNEKELYAYTSGEQFLFEYPSHGFDLVFLDIQMKGRNGLEIARKVREQDKNVAIVFLTNDPSFVFEGYEVDAIRYWLKPIDPTKLEELLTSIQLPKAYLLWNIEGELTKLYESDILYLESDGHYVIAHHIEGIYRKKGNFHEECKKLSDVFLLSHRSYCVNLHHVHALGKDTCRMDQGDMVPISRSMKGALQEAMMKKCQEDLLWNG